MSRLSNDQRDANGNIINGYDYDHQAWVKDGKYVRCGHPESMDCGCFGREHAGEPVRKPVELNNEPFDFGSSDKVPQRRMVSERPILSSIYELISYPNSQDLGTSHGKFETMSEARLCAAVLNLTYYAIYLDACVVEWKREQV
jgi:hypothetical protein